jgi:hypothetical protein
MWPLFLATFESVWLLEALPKRGPALVTLWRILRRERDAKAVVGSQVHIRRTADKSKSTDFRVIVNIGINSWLVQLFERKAGEAEFCENMTSFSEFDIAW